VVKKNNGRKEAGGGGREPHLVLVVLGKHHAEEGLKDDQGLVQIPDDHPSLLLAPRDLDPLPDPDPLDGIVRVF
jgi:hypothetical protein